MKKGFTLIELLAVILILGIIALIAVPAVSNIVEDAKKGATEQSVNQFINAIDKQIAINQMNSDPTDDINDGTYDIPLDSKYRVKLKGQTPTDGWVKIEDGNVSEYSLVLGDYTASYDGTNKIIVKGDNFEPSETIVYSRVNCTTHVGYPIDANQDVGDKYVWTVSYSKLPHNTLEECIENGGSNEKCILQNFKTPNLDYKSAPDASWKYYLKHFVNSNNIIEKIEVCGKFEGKEFCLENGGKSSKFEQNKSLLLETFGDEKCSYSASHVHCDSSVIHAHATSEGYIHVYVAISEDDCYVYNGGATECWVRHP